MMFFLNKITAFLIIISFVFSGETFAREPMREEGRRAPTIRQHAKRTPRASEGKKDSPRARRKVSRKKTPAQMNRLEAKKTAARAKIEKKKAAVQAKAEAKKAAIQAKPEAKKTATKAEAEAKKIAARAKIEAKKAAVQAKPEAKKAAARAEVEAKKVAARAKVEAKKATAKAEVEAKKATAKAKAIAKSAQGKVVIRMQDIPEDLKNDMILLGIKKKELQKNRVETISQKELTELLATLEESEPELKEALSNHEYLKGIGLDSGLSEDEIRIMEMAVGSNNNDLTLSKRLRDFLESNTNFQG